MVELYENNDISQNNMKIKIFTGAVCGLSRIMLLRGDALKKIYLTIYSGNSKRYTGTRVNNMI